MGLLKKSPYFIPCIQIFLSDRRIFLFYSSNPQINLLALVWSQNLKLPFMRKFAVVGFPLRDCPVVFAVSCSKSRRNCHPIRSVTQYIRATFGTNIDPDNLASYAGQGHPAYITLDNSGSNGHQCQSNPWEGSCFMIKLSINNTVACGGCPNKEFAFSDTARIQCRCGKRDLPSFHEAGSIQGLLRKLNFLE